MEKDCESLCESAKEKLQSLVKEKFAKPLHSLKSFEELSECANLSPQTLRRFFGKIDSDNKTTVSSLSLLCNYIGFHDWESFLNHLENRKSVSEQSRNLIDGMEVFFRNGEKYDTDYFQKTSIVDTLNDYAKIIYSCRENTEYFYERYQDNNWATDYILGWIPNYNFFGQNWFRKILFDKSQKTKIAHVRLSQTNFICLGAFLSKNDAEFNTHFQNLETIYLNAQKEFGYMPYHEMRYTTIRLMNDSGNAEHIISEYLENLRAQHFSKENYQELLIFFANTLFWLKQYQPAYEILKEAKSYLVQYQKRTDKSFLHYYGMNMAFMKATFSLVYLANNDKDIEDFETDQSDFSDYAGLLYRDYAQLLYLAKCILTSHNSAQNKHLFSELQCLTDKTQYRRIYDILADFDCGFSSCGL